MGKLKLPLSILAVLLGPPLFVFAEIDDSPGGQLIGLVLAVAGLVGVVRWVRGRNQ